MPKTTNLHDLPPPLFRALNVERRRPVRGRISATALIDSPLRRRLQMEYFDGIEEDASDNLWALLGKAMHYIIEQHGSADTSEVKRECVHKSGATLVSIGDYIENDRLIDWKITSVWAFVLGVKEEWIRQLNVVRYIYGKNNIPVAEMYIYAILRDFMKGKRFTPGYPDIPFQKVPIPIWSDEEANKYIDERVALHLYSEDLPINRVPQCSSGERWSRPTTYAVIKPNVKKALRVFDSRDLAEEYQKKASIKTKCEIVERIGSDVKCEQYCNVSFCCPYVKQSNVGQ